MIHRLSVELSPNLLEKQQEGGAEMTFIDTVKVLIVPQWGEDSTLIDWAPDGTDSSTRKVTCKTEVRRPAFVLPGVLQSILAAWRCKSS